MGKNHHKRENYITIIKMICRETNRFPNPNLEKFSDYNLLFHLNRLLVISDCIGLTKEELEIDLQ